MKQGHHLKTGQENKVEVAHFIQACVAASVILRVVVGHLTAKIAGLMCILRLPTSSSRVHLFEAARDVFTDETLALGGGRQALEVGGGHGQSLAALQLHAREVTPRVAHPVCHPLAQQAVPRDRHQPEPACT